MAVLTPAELKRRRMKNIALATGLFALFGLFYVITVVKIVGAQNGVQ